MNLDTAYTRVVSPRLAECALTHFERQPIDAARAARQHEAYEAALTAAGLAIERLPPLPDHPDGVFVEDTALILGGHTVITRPGAPTRAGETESTADRLAQDLEVHRLPAGHVDGGDVLRIGRILYVGLSARTDREGLVALERTVRPLGYGVVAVPIRACLHLKSAVTFAGPDGAGDPVLVYDPAAIDPGAFAGVEPLAAGEPAGANVLRVGRTLVMAAGCPATQEMLEGRGFSTIALDVSELQKAEAGLTCMSLIVAKE
jgi:dimethylargininase